MTVSPAYTELSGGTDISTATVLRCKGIFRNRSPDSATRQLSYPQVSFFSGDNWLKVVHSLVTTLWISNGFLTHTRSD